MKTYGFIGCGNMGGALIGCANDAVSGNSIFVYDINEEKARAFEKTIGASYAGIEKIAASCDYIILGVKPQSMQEMLESIKDVLASREKPPVLISMAAAVSTDRIREMLGGDTIVHIIRIMPNLAVSVNSGVILYSSSLANADEICDFKNLFRSGGMLLELEEDLIDAGCALSGSGPAFVYKFIDELARGGESAGLKKQDAKNLAIMTVLGAARVMNESGEEPSELITKVCSPGGTTIEGINSLEAGNFSDEVVAAVMAAYDRAKELAHMK